MCCLTNDQLDRLRGSDTGVEERQRLLDHMSHCPSCRRRWVAADHDEQELRASSADAPEFPPDLMARARGLPRRTAPRLMPRRWRRAVAAGLATLAAGGLLWLMRPTERPEALRSDDSETLRDLADGAPRLEILTPAAGAAVAAGPMTFRWSPVTDAVRYRLDVVDTRGDLLRRVDTIGTSVEVALDLTRYETGATIYFFVSARLVDGTSETSRLGKLTVAPP